MNIRISPRKFFLAMLYMIAALLALHIVCHVIKFCCTHNHMMGLVPLFNFDAEANVPTFFSALSLLFSSVLLFVISIGSKRKGSHFIPWLLLSVFFLFLTIDEIAFIHEHFSAALRARFHTSGMLYFAWIIPYGMALLVFVLCYSKFLIDLPRKTRILFLVSGAIFIAGALGFELLGGRHLSLHGGNNVAYALYYTCEELLEMLGIALFNYALLLYIVNAFQVLTITLGAETDVDVRTETPALD